MKSWILRFLLLIGVLSTLALAVGWYQTRDRNAGGDFELAIAGGEPGSLRAGFAAVPITPEIPDQWVDVNGDAVFSESEGDYFIDGNANGEFDAVWMAGFQNSRPANGIHDDLWARAMVLDDGTSRIGLVVLDVIGLHHDDVLEIRSRIAKLARVDYTIVASTHNHEAPDTLGLWGPNHFSSGVDPEYREEVIRGAAAAVVSAVDALRPARLRIVEDTGAGRQLVTDTRPPEVYDPGIRLIQAIDTGTGSSLGVLVSWANHPETVWNRNLLVTSDFPHFLREGIEKGVGSESGPGEPGLGGTAVYVNGPIGGLITTSPSVGVRDPVTGIEHTEPSFDKAQAQGRLLALEVLRMLRGGQVFEMESGRIELQARTIRVPLDNLVFRLGVLIGVLDRGFSGWMQLRSEVAAWTLGPLSFVCIPGEIYPEIVTGGIEAPPGQDFATGPVEVPPIRSLMPGTYRFVLGLANDEIGYIIPKSEWDDEPPYLYGAEESLYGEITSTGPEAGPIVHREVRDLLSRLGQ